MASKTKTLAFFMFAVFAVAMVAASASAVVLADWSFTTDGSSSNVASGVTASAFTGGSGVGTISFSGGVASSGGWPQTGSPESDEYFQVQLTASAGTTVVLSDIDFDASRSDTGPVNYIVGYSTDGFATSTQLGGTFVLNVANTDTDGSISGQSITVNPGEVLTIRWFPYSASSTGNFRISQLSLEGTASSGSSTSLSLFQVTPLTKTQNGVVRVTNTGTTALSNILLTDSGDFDVTFSPATISSLSAGASTDVIVSAADLEDAGFGGESVTITATSGSASDTLTMTVGGSFCKAGPQGGNLEITDVKIDNQGEGKDDEWLLLDTIEVEVEVENNGDDDIDDVFIEIGLFDSSGRNQVNDLDFDNADEEEFDVGRINDGKDETVTFRFKVPADFEDGSYRLAVKAYSDDLGEDEECTDESSDLSDDTFEAIDVERESDEGKFIAFDDFVVSPSEATCGEPVSLTFKLFNIGDEDQDDRVRVNIFSSELDLDDSVEITKDIDQGDDETVNFQFAVPNGASDGLHQIRINADYDYNRGSYRESSDEDTVFALRVLGCGVGGPSTSDGNFAAISAVLDSDAVAGEELIVRATITNIGDEAMGFVVDPRGFSSWATLDSVSQNVLQLTPGQSRDVTMRFMVDEDASGEESFVIEVQAGGMIESREVVVNIGGAGSGSAGGAAGLDFGDNTYLWIIGIVNVILIILIIIVAVRISRR